MQEFNIRPVKPEDAAAALEVYKPYVLNTPITFEYGQPSVEDFKYRIQSNAENYPWLVCEHKGKITGYAYGNTHRYKTAYQWSVESTIYVSEAYHRLGIARVLYETLFEMLKLQGYINVFAGVVIPNPKSEGFHLALGFYEIGIFRKIGYKFGKWHDTRWFELNLADHRYEPPVPKTMAEIENTTDFQFILQKANEKLKNIRF